MKSTPVCYEKGGDDPLRLAHIVPSFKNLGNYSRKL